MRFGGVKYLMIVLSRPIYLTNRLDSILALSLSLVQGSRLPHGSWTDGYKAEFQRAIGGRPATSRERSFQPGIAEGRLPTRERPGGIAEPATALAGLEKGRTTMKMKIVLGLLAATALTVRDDGRIGRRQDPGHRGEGPRQPVLRADPSRLREGQWRAQGHLATPACYTGLASSADRSRRDPDRRRPADQGRRRASRSRPPTPR